ncbi:MAG: hypothetical protein A3K77_00815 [Euryarchaeota archaeon RBG_13_31_8]|nr:MAG: hypothetical protein A3K77_00815 [Euryarchaeota archaeon RBG_13_31_8]
MKEYFLNISNHPSTKWGEEQYIAACRLGKEIIDIPFPNVPPQASESEVRDLMISLIREVNQYKDPACHVMGEQGLTYALVRKLIDARLHVYHSTTERIVVDGESGQKTAQFKFVQFRRY